MHLNGLVLLLVAGGTVGFIHSLLPDHWVPLAVVARTQRWTMLRLARVSTLAAGGHVLTSVALGGLVAIIGLQFQSQIETQQGHIVGGVLILTGLGFLVWGLTGHGHLHEHNPDEPHDHEERHDGHDQGRDHDHHAEEEYAHSEVRREQAAHSEEHVHQHQLEETPPSSGVHVHVHAHEGVRHSHRHSHEAFIRARADTLATHLDRGSFVGHLAAIAVPFGVAASPDLTFFPVAIAASAYGRDAIGGVLVVFAVVTMVTFVGLTVVATAVGYQMRGEWLERNANTITSLVLIAIGVVAFIGF